MGSEVLMPALTIVVPTFNEEGNVSDLVKKIVSALCIFEMNVRILFVDDSLPADAHGHSLTVLAIQRAAALYTTLNGRFSVEVIHRKGPDRVGSLSGAVARGFHETDSELVAVMDGDGQHPPIVLRAMIETFLDRDVDIVIASRYTNGGDPGGLDGGLRRFVSKASTWLAKGLFPRRLCDVSDPMTGYFMVRRDVLRCDALNPQGFKILLEVLVTHKLRIFEVPMRFEDRLSGESKASSSQGKTYLRQLLQLRFGI